MKPILTNFKERIDKAISFKNALSFIFIFYLSFANLVAQPGPVQEWQKTYMASGNDYIRSWAETSDGYLIGGSSNSVASGDKIESSRGGTDYWIIKIDKSGIKQWDKTYGGPGADNLSVIIPTSDGFLLGGSSNSGIGGDKTEAGRGDNDFWVVKINSMGQKQWDKRFGGTSQDYFAKVVSTSDGGFLLAGTSHSPASGDKTEEMRSYSDGFRYAMGDFWIVKISATGEKLWDKTYGGKQESDSWATAPQQGDDRLTSLIALPDGGFLLGGNSNSLKGFEKSVSSDHYDYWVVKINASGAVVADYVYLDYFSYDKLTDIFPTPDGNFLLTGHARWISSQDEQSIEYTSAISLKKISPHGVLIWEESDFYQESSGYNYNNFHAAASGQGITIVLDYETDSEQYQIKIDWQGHLSSMGLFNDAKVSFLKYNSKNEMFAGVVVYEAGPDYGLIKFKPELNLPPSLDLELSRDRYFKALSITALPQNFNTQIRKVIFYVDEIKVAELATQPYYYSWPEKGYGDHKIRVVAITTDGREVTSKTYSARVFYFYGIQGEEPGHYTEVDAGTHPVKEEKEPTLNCGSSLRLWDAGDARRFYLRLPAGSYIIKVNLRSGYYTQTSSKPTSYWPDGYSFTFNGVPKVFTGDPASIVKNEAYGGSYWGNMVSERITVSKFGDNRLVIEANKKWAGIDYIEVFPLDKIEAESNFTPITDVGTRPIESSGPTVKLWDSGDKVNIKFNASEGDYIVKARVRSGYYTATLDKPQTYWPNRYIFWLNDLMTTFTGDPTTIRKEVFYGGSYWGVMQTGIIHLNAGLQNLTILSNAEWAGVDYIELVPIERNSARLSEPDLLHQFTAEVFPNPFNDYLQVSGLARNETVYLAIYDISNKEIYRETRNLKEEESFTIDLNGKNIKSGLYLLKIKSSLGEKVIRISHQ